MEKFVCIRMVQGNGMDLSLFQFDYDMSFAVFFLNADRTIYGRYGSRSHKPKEAHTDISLEGLAAAMKGALALHAKFPANREALRSKTGPKPAVPVPEDLPNLADSGRDRPELATGDRKTIARSCIHCHMIHDSEREPFFTKTGPVPPEIMFPWPMPEVVGLGLDRTTAATVKRVIPGTPARKAGLEPGDIIEELDGQPVLSIADVQWVLDQSGDHASIPATVRRNGKTFSTNLNLEPGWRAATDISWRASSWPLRRVATGGLVLTALDPGERKHRRIPDRTMALRVEHVGQFNKHAAAKRAGFRKNDLIVSFDGRNGAWTESDLFAYVLEHKKAGDRVPVTVVRGDRKLDLKLPVQE